MSLLSKTPIYFGSYLITPQASFTFSPHNSHPTSASASCIPVFYTTPLSYALVNLKPILPGHVLVCPLRPVPRLADLSTSETSDLFLTVRRVSRMIERVYLGTSLNIAIQDGPEAGQSVPHVHVHIIPRRKADLDHRGGSDALYGMMEGDEGDIAKQLGELAEAGKEGVEVGRVRFPAVDNEARKPRSEEEMRAEALALAKEMEGEPVD
ncbi:hypothetical protein ACO22_04841 [Paracoccidioides brasiliensis]|uniref:Bis(5'-adenosyl)-triphosphatase n=1 Tax=Paracoccidioides brasiliensis TaxID=121759 RepID=A0A1D2JBX3_PARBR|nr:hypothetical protein ACO22_04841 [Paracoccidioides brasiliensis]